VPRWAPAAVRQLSPPRRRGRRWNRRCRTVARARQRAVVDALFAARVSRRLRRCCNPPDVVLRADFGGSSG
jgi:hypothetical protein